MRHLWPLALLLVLILGPATPSAEAAAKRTGGQQSKIRSVRKPKKLEIKAPVYNAKKHRPHVVKRKPWWRF